MNRNQKVDVKFGRTDERCYDSPPTVIGTSGFYWPAGSIYSASKKLPNGYFRWYRHSFTDVTQNSVEYEIYRLEDYKKFILSSAAADSSVAPCSPTSLSSGHGQELTIKS